MSSIVRNKVGKYTYLYESESYRDSKGKPCTRKVSIGRIDPHTGEPVYKPEYLKRVQGTDRQPDISNVKQYTKTILKARQFEIMEHFISWNPSQLRSDLLKF